MRTSGFDTVSAAELDRKAIGRAGTSASPRFAPLAADGFGLLQATSIALPSARPTGAGFGNAGADLARPALRHRTGLRTFGGMAGDRRGRRASAAGARGDAAMGRIA